MITDEILEIITSHVYASFTFCHREGWYSARRIHGEETNDWMARGRLVEKMYKRKGYRQVWLYNSVIDLVDDVKNNIRIVEVKASKKSLERARHQAQYLLYLLHRAGIDGAIAEVVAPSSKKKETIIPSEEMFTNVETNILYFYSIAMGELPYETYSSKCKACAYKVLCWGDKDE